MATVRELVTKWGFEIDDKELQKLKADTEKLRMSFVKLGAVASAALAAVVVPAAQLEASMKDALTMTNATGDALDDLEDRMTKKAKSLSNKLGIAGTEVATSFYQVLSTGAEPLSDQFNKLSETGLKLAKTVGLDASNAIETLNDVTNAFTTSDGVGPGFQRVADVLFSGSKLASTAVPQLTDAMREAAPAALQLGVSLEETVGLLGNLADKGFKGSLAGTALRVVFSRLTAPTGAARKEFEKLGVKFADAEGNIRPIVDILRDLKVRLGEQTQAQRLATLKVIAGEEASAKLGAILSSNLDVLDNNITKLGTMEGALDTAFDIKMSSASEKTKLFVTNVKNLAATIGEPLLEPLGQAVGKLTEWAQALGKILDENPRLAEATALILGSAAALAIFVSVLGTALTTVKLFSIAMGFSGIIPILIKFITTIKTAGAVVLWFVKGAALLTGPIGILVALLGVLAIRIANNKKEYLEFWNIVKDAAGKSVDWVVEKFDSLLEKMKSVKKTLSDISLRGLAGSIGGFLGIGGNAPLTAPTTTTGSAGTASPNVNVAAPQVGVSIAVNGLSVNDVEDVAVEVNQQQQRATAAALGVAR